MTGDLLPTGVVTVCCEIHHADGCCDPNDCGPCCQDCPTCPRLKWHRGVEFVERWLEPLVPAMLELARSTWAVLEWAIPDALWDETLFDGLPMFRGWRIVRDSSLLSGPVIRKVGRR